MRFNQECHSIRTLIFLSASNSFRSSTSTTDTDLTMLSQRGPTLMIFKILCTVFVYVTQPVRLKNHSTDFFVLFLTASVGRPVLRYLFSFHRHLWSASEKQNNGSSLYGCSPALLFNNSIVRHTFPGPANTHGRCQHIIKQSLAPSFFLF